MVTLVTAFERQTMLDRNIEDLPGKVIVMDDHSQPPLVSSHEVIYAPHNHGKKQYWKWINTALERLEDTEGPVIFTADDISIKDIFRPVRLLESVDGPSCINLLDDGRIKCWNKIVRVKHNKELYRSGFVDGCFICSREVLELLGYRINPINLSRWRNRPLLGSGVWQQFTQRCLDLGVGIYQDRSKNFQHGRHSSKMNPQARKKQPLV